MPALALKDLRASPRRPIPAHLLKRQPKSLKNVEDVYAARLVLAVSVIQQQINQHIMPNVAEWVERVQAQRADAHVQNPGSRGGHIVGYTAKGEPIYSHKPHGKKIINPHEIKNKQGELIKHKQSISKVHVAINPTRAWWLHAHGSNLDYGDNFMRWLKHEGDLVVWTGPVSHAVVSQHLGATGNFDNTSDFIGGIVHVKSLNKANVYTLYGVDKENIAWVKAKFKAMTRVDSLLDLLRSDARIKRPGSRGDHSDNLHLDLDEFEVIGQQFDRLRLNTHAREAPMSTATRLAAIQTANLVANANAQSAAPVLERLLHVDPFASEPWLMPLSRDWVSENVSLIKSIGEKHLTEVEHLIYRMTRQGESIKTIRAELEDRFGVTKNRARLIARDQVNKYNGQLTQERQVRAGISMYRWRNRQDRRVRGWPGGEI